MTVGFSVASLGLYILTMCVPSFRSAASYLAIGSAFAAFGNGVSMKCHENSIDKIKIYEANMLSYIKLVDHDMKTTEKMMDLFFEAEQMLTEDIPFDKNKWQDMIKYLLEGENVDNL